jgi:hypothetical protein
MAQKGELQRPVNAFRTGVSTIDSPRPIAILEVMTTLTKEYFDQRIDVVEKNIEKKIEDEIHGLATMVAKGFDDLAKRLDVRDRVEKLEKKMTKVESALNGRL